MALIAGVTLGKKYIENQILKGDDAMAILDGKKVIIIGDRDGVPGPAIEECAKTAGADVIYSSTECFV